MLDTEAEDADVDINLLSELLEIAERNDPCTESVSSEKNTAPQSFDSILEDLDKMPVNTASRSKLIDKTSQFNNQSLSKKCVKTIKGSAVHTGDTDSSDDEDARKHGSTVDNFGANVKRMMKSADEEKRTAPRLSELKAPYSSMPSWKSPASSPAPNTLCLPVKINKTGPMDVYTDSSVGIRIINPLVSSSVIKERLVGRKAVSMSQVKQFITEGKTNDDWVIFGVIISKAPPRTSSKGNTYSIIKLSDLRGPESPKMVSLFLFSSAFKKHGKDTVGTVLGILNPRVMDNSRSHGDEACLSVDNSDRVMVLGTSKDFGLCKSMKKNGENCTSVVNTAQCEYCVYHVKQEYQKCSRRSDIQSSFNGSGLSNLRNKVLGKNEVFYGGQSFSAIPATKNKKLIQKDQSRLSILSGASKLPPSLGLKAISKSGVATSVELSHRQSQKDMDRLRKLILDDSKSLSKPINNPDVIAKYNPDEVKPDEAKLVALALIAEKKSSESPSPIVSRKTDVKPSPSSMMRDAAIMSESVPQSRGVVATLALNKKQGAGQITASSLGLGRSTPSDDTVIVKKEMAVSTKHNSVPNKTAAPLKTSPEACIKPKSTANRKLADKPTTAPLSSGQLRKLASNGLDLESRMLKQAAQQAAFQEEVAKLCLNPTPSMLGLGRSLPLVTMKTGSASILNSSPQLGKGLSQSLTIDLNAPISKKILNAAKLNAINIVRNKGGISKEDPNYREFESRKKPTKESKVAKRPLEEASNPTTDILKRFKPVVLEQDKDAEARKARFKELMEVTSRHTDLINAAENEAQENYFGKLEKKEQMEEKMLNTFKVACKAVRCLTCKYTSFSASEFCKTQRHPLKVMDGTKRFFKCGDCGNRTVSLEVIPLLSCSNCKGSRWERTAMIRERKVGVSKETLSVRGMEEMYIGSVTTGANVNLLVPEDGT